eukprot:scaffold77126_cov31-Prasinocladus_malaysianus.AAC.1
MGGGRWYSYFWIYSLGRAFFQLRLATSTYVRATGRARCQKTPPRKLAIRLPVGRMAPGLYLERGFAVTVFERAPRLGGVWNTAYRNVRLQQNKLDFKLSDYEWPEGTPDFP